MNQQGTMANDSSAAQVVYVCPMHKDVRQSAPGKCPKCNMDLMPEGTRFGMLRHMVRSPMMIGVVIVAVAAVAAVLLLR